MSVFDIPPNVIDYFRTHNDSFCTDLIFWFFDGADVWSIEDLSNQIITETVIMTAQSKNKEFQSLRKWFRDSKDSW